MTKRGGKGKRGGEREQKEGKREEKARGGGENKGRKGKRGV